MGFVVSLDEVGLAEAGRELAVSRDEMGLAG